MARFGLALIVLPVAALAAVGCGGGAVSSTAPPPGSTLLRYSSGATLRSAIFGPGSRGRTLLPGTYVAGGAGRSALIPHWRHLYVHGTTIGYPGGSSLAVHGMPTGWHVTTAAPAPGSTSSLVAETESNKAGIELCGKGLGMAYQVQAGRSTRLLSYDPCHEDPLFAWSSTGSRIAYIAGPDRDLFVSNPAGTARTKLTVDGRVVRFLWSPDGTRIAYEYGTIRALHVAVVDVATKARRVLASGSLGAWSPDGKQVAVARGARLAAVTG